LKDRIAAMLEMVVILDMAHIESYIRPLSKKGYGEKREPMGGKSI